MTNNRRESRNTEQQQREPALLLLNKTLELRTSFGFRVGNHDCTTKTAKSDRQRVLVQSSPKDDQTSFNGFHSLPHSIRSPFRPDDARELGAYLLRELGLRHCRISGGKSGFQAEARSTPIASSKFISLACKTDLRLEMQAESAQILWIAVHGTVRFQSGREIVTCAPETACVWPVLTDVRAAIGPEHRALIIRIDRQLLDLRLARMLGRPARDPVQFKPWMTFHGPERGVGLLAQFMSEDLEREVSVLGRSRPLANATEALLLDMLLATQQHNYSGAIAALSGVPLPRRLKAVIAAIEADPAHPWTVGKMAQVSGVSVHTLCDNFARFRGCTAKQFLLSVRLGRFREELLEAQSSVSVAAAARKWGFSHPGRLAGMYRKVFGEAPSDTLRRSDVVTRA